jgi:electron transfer flavoprotein-quinone oxidoreductase
MRRAITTGMMAAETFLQADQAGSFAGAALSSYQSRLAPVYRDIGRSKNDSRVSESRFVYQFLPRILFSTFVLYRERKILVEQKKRAWKDAVQRVQAGTSLLNYDEDKDYSHIKVDLEKGSASALKPWVPGCPVNCYTLVTAKGVFASYTDLLENNVRPLQEKFKEANGFEAESLELRAMESAAFDTTLKDIAEGRLRFDHVACVACGTCGQIGPEETVDFGPERDGHGVRYRYG